MEKNIFAFLLLFSMYITVSTSLYAEMDIQPELNCTSAVLLDENTGVVLYSKKSDMPIPPASMTKLMTLDLVYNAIDSGKLSKNQMVTIDKEADFRSLPPRSSLMFLQEGQRVSVFDLMRGLAVPSGNDAAIALAKVTAGSVAAFVSLMNSEAKKLGFVTMHFADASGLSAKNSVTAGDFAAFCAYYIKKHPSSLKELHSLTEFTYPKKKNIPPGESSVYGPITQKNRNSLLGIYSWADGLKTGYIDESGYNIAATAEKNGRRLIAVLMGGPGKNAGEGSFIRALDAVNLLSYGFYRFTDYKPDPGVLKPVRIYGGKENYLTIIYPDIKKITIPRELTYQTSIELEISPLLTAPVAQNAQVGSLHIKMRGKDIALYPVLAGQNIERGSVVKRIVDRIRLFFARPVKYRNIGP